MILLMLFLFAAAAAGAFRGYGLLSAALDGRRTRPDETTHLSEFALKKQMHEMHATSQMNGWLSVVSVREVVLPMGAYQHHAWVYEPLRSNVFAPWALVLHGGLGTDHTQMLDAACELSLAGYRVVMPDLAGHGKSGGTLSFLGIREKDDVHAWIEWIKREDPLARIVILGMDEGAAAALLAASSGMDEAVLAIAADSPYQDAMQRCMQMLEETHGSISPLDRFWAGGVYRLLAGDPENGNLVEAMSRCRVPVLLIYGTGDEETPAWMGEDMSSASQGRAQMLLIEGAVHGAARYGDPKAYYDAVLTHFDKAVRER